MEQAAILELIASSLAEVLAETEEAMPPGEVIGPETALLGRAAVLDSLGLVQLIIEVEQRLAEQHGIAVTLADERAMSQQRSPFRTVATLAEYVDTLVREGAGPGGA